MCLDDSCFICMGGYGNISGFLEECLDGNGIGCIISVLIDNFEYIILIENCCCYLYVVCVLVIRYWYFMVCEWNLIVWNSNGF